MMRAITPATLAPPFARYSHGVLVEPGARLVATSGQLGLAADGAAPPGALDQARICFANIAAILEEAGGAPRHVIRINAYVTDRAHMADYMAARDEWLNDVSPPPASTLMIVGGFTRPEFLVEVEALAAIPA
ncbi:MAG: RidA family protein [Pseudomonadota bacterium]